MHGFIDRCEGRLVQCMPYRSSIKLQCSTVEVLAPCVYICMIVVSFIHALFMHTEVSFASLF